MNHREEFIALVDAFDTLRLDHAQAGPRALTGFEVRIEKRVMGTGCANHRAEVPAPPSLGLTTCRVGNVDLRLAVKLVRFL
jgi:hypothetical protein